MVTTCTTGFNIQKPCVLPTQCIYVFCVDLRTNSVNWLVCITERECVYCAVRTGSLYIIEVMCFVWIWEQTAIISLYSFNWLAFITETESVYCAVRTESLYIIHVMCFVLISEQTAISSLYSFNWLAFITETESVYCAVRTGCLYLVYLKTTQISSRSASFFYCTLISINFSSPCRI